MTVSAASGLTRAGGISRGAGLNARARVIGAKQAIAKFRLIDQTVFRDTGLIIANSARSTANRAKEILKAGGHIDTGNLYDGIFAVQIAPYTWQVVASSVAGGSDREYAGYIENGFTHYLSGSFVGPFPFMRPAMSEQRPKTQRALTALAVKIQRL